MVRPSPFALQQRAGVGEMDSRLVSEQGRQSDLEEIHPMSRVSRWLGLCAALGVFGVSIVRADTIAISGVPNSSGRSLRAIYKPLVRYLAARTGLNVRFREPTNLFWLGHMLRHHTVSLVFAGPAVVDWAIRYTNYAPVLAGTGSLRLIVVSQKPGVTLKALRGEVVCAVSPPNLASLALLARYNGTVVAPYIVQVRSPAAAVAGVLSGRCKAAPVPVRFARAGLVQGALHRVVGLGSFPAMAFIAGGPGAAKIESALRSSAALPALEPLARTYRIPGWAVPKPGTYRGLSSWLAGFPGFARAK